MMGVSTKERKGVTAEVLMATVTATPCTKSLGGESGGHKPAAIPTVALDKAGDTNFAGNVREQAAKPTLRQGPPLGPQQREIQ